MSYSGPLKVEIRGLNAEGKALEGGITYARIYSPGPRTKQSVDRRTWTIVDGTAKFGEDITKGLGSSSDSIRFPWGGGYEDVRLPIVADQKTEGVEYFDFAVGGLTTRVYIADNSANPSDTPAEADKQGPLTRKDRWGNYLPSQSAVAGKLFKWDISLIAKKYLDPEGNGVNIRDLRIRGVGPLKSLGGSVYTFPDELNGFNGGISVSYKVVDDLGNVGVNASIGVDIKSSYWEFLANSSSTGSASPNSSSGAALPTDAEQTKTGKILDFRPSSKPRDIVGQWLGSGTSSQQALTLPGGDRLNIQASSWSGEVKLKSVAQAGSSGGRLEAPQIDDLTTGNQGSVLNGAGGKDQIQAKAGWDVIDGGANDDFIRAGNGRDIITGGLGADQLWGDFGWNTYKSEKDGFRDLIAIKSDQNLVNWLYGKAGNNANGQKADIIEGLDANDVIKILGASTGSLSFANTSAHGLSGIGIFVGDVLEALYTGGDLSIDQIRTMTSGDASTAAMNNTLSGYGSW